MAPVQFVSIPFKREGLSEHESKDASGIRIVHVSIPFKREGLSELLKHISEMSRPPTVSIPFKREGLSEHRIQKLAAILIKFQFPSNGKVFPNLPPCEPSHSKG